MNIEDEIPGFERLSFAHQMELRRLPRDDDGKRVCHCGAALSGVHCRCAECLADPARADAAQRESERFYTIKSRAEANWSNAPRWPGNKPGSPEFAATVKDPKLRSFAEKYDGKKSAALVGPSGIAKTTTVVYAFRRIAADALTLCRAQELKSDFPVRFIGGARFVKSYDLVRARKLHPLGEDEAPLVKQAKEATLLALDDLGNEPADSVMFEVLDERHDRDRPTLITAGFPVPVLINRYGAALWRRIAERGQVIDLFSKDSK